VVVVVVGMSLGGRNIRASDAIVDLGKRTDRREVLRGRPKDVFELVPRLVEPAELEQGAAEGDAR
jgi:hypothetical protein